MLLTSCTPGSNEVKEAPPASEAKSPPLKEALPSAKEWPNAVFYEIFVRSFHDSNGDGIGDFKGMTEKLDYLQDLGVEAIWLMPINASPSYHGYDVTDYYAVNPEYGTLEEFKEFLNQAHQRNIKVIMDLVVNHASSEHPWFKEAMASEDSPYRDWFLWADSETNLSERGEWNQTLWHGSSPNQYYGYFWGGMPDFNFENPEVKQEMFKIGKFWLQEVGVDGFRLDAAKHIYHDPKDPKNVEWWKEFRQEMVKAKEDVFLVGEVWAPAAAVAPYLQDGLQSAFNFDLSEKILTAAQTEKDSGIATSLSRVREYFNKMSADFVDSTFITNHDMNRTMTQLKGNVNHAKMAASLLLTLPGNPFLYYGEEIGMEGAKPDENIREPLLWYKDPTTPGQTAWMAPRHNKGDKATSIEEQATNPDSLYQHYKTMIHTRRAHEALILGEIREAPIPVEGIISFERYTDKQNLLVIHNMSKDPKTITLPEKLTPFSNIWFATNTEIALNNHELTLTPYSTVILSQ